MKCPSCRRHELVAITLKVGGEKVILRSCSTCELRSWEGLDGSIGLPSVLALAATR